MSMTTRFARARSWAARSSWRSRLSVVAMRSATTAAAIVPPADSALMNGSAPTSPNQWRTDPRAPVMPRAAVTARRANGPSAHHSLTTRHHVTGAIVRGTADKVAERAVCCWRVPPPEWSVCGASELTSVAIVTASKHSETTKSPPEQGFRVVRRQGFEPRTR